MRQAGVESASLDARLLMQHALDCAPEAIIAAPERLLTPQEAEAFAALVRRRCAREPVSHLLGAREFWGLRFAVGQQVLDPRPDSETLIETVLAARPQQSEKINILDLGTGSGCLLLALLSEYKNAQGTGADISHGALEIAQRNAHTLALDERVKFVQSDWGDRVTETYDVVVSNPPYIAQADYLKLAPEVRDYEPIQALLAGEDGLACYRALIPQLPRLLAPGGLAVLEIGHTQAEAVTEMLAQAGLKHGGVKTDLAGLPRCVWATA